MTESEKQDFMKKLGTKFQMSILWFAYVVDYALDCMKDIAVNSDRLLREDIKSC